MKQPLLSSPPLFAARPGYWKRVLHMTLIWLFFGILIGAGTAPQGHGIVGIVCGVMAGMIVMPFLGVVLGLMGGEARQALLGGTCGLIIGLIAGALSQDAGLLLKASVCLVGGAICGATISTPLYWYRRLLGSR